MHIAENVAYLKFMINNQLKYFACSNMQFIRSEKDVFNRCDITYRNTSETEMMECCVNANRTLQLSNNKHAKCTKMKKTTLKLSINK